MTSSILLVRTTESTREPLGVVGKGLLLISGRLSACYIHVEDTVCPGTTIYHYLLGKLPSDAWHQAPATLYSHPTHSHVSIMVWT